MLRSETKPDLDLIDAQIDLEDAMELASSKLEIAELLEEANRHGDAYGAGFGDGFWKGYSFICKKARESTESIIAKYGEVGI